MDALACWLESQLQLLVQVKTFPVMAADAVAGDGLAMLPGRVALIGVPLIVGKLQVDLFHVFVPVGFRQYGGRRY